MRLILLGSLLHRKKQLPVGGVPVYSQMSRSKSQQFSQLSLVLGLQENGELLQEVESTMVSSSWIRRECVHRVHNHTHGPHSPPCPPGRPFNCQYLGSLSPAFVPVFPPPLEARGSPAKDAHPSSKHRSGPLVYSRKVGNPACAGRVTSGLMTADRDF